RSASRAQSSRSSVAVSVPITAAVSSGRNIAARSGSAMPTSAPAGNAQRACRPSSRSSAVMRRGCPGPGRRGRAPAVRAGCCRSAGRGGRAWAATIAHGAPALHDLGDVARESATPPRSSFAGRRAYGVTCPEQTIQGRRMTLRRLLGIELPIIQAPMAGVQGSALAAAVSNAGGLGSLPCAMLSLDALREELAALRAKTDRPFNVNFFCHRPPTPSTQREAAWRATLQPYYREFGI